MFRYIAQPYIHDDHEVMDKRYLAAAGYCAYLAHREIVLFAPIVHWHEVAKTFELPRGHEYWLKIDHAMIEASSRLDLLQLSGWENSRGCYAEIAYAEQAGKPVYTVNASTYKATLVNPAMLLEEFTDYAKDNKEPEPESRKLEIVKSGRD